MSPGVEQQAALVALLRAKVRGYTWHDIATEAWIAGDAASLWRDLTAGDALVPDPRAEAELAVARRDVLRWQSDGLRFLSILDGEFPARLRDIREAPPFLFASGTLLANDFGMSVVGSRKASERGHQVARAAARILVDKGLTVIAGLAEGIDTTAHETALECNGRTVAFIGTGITRHYPARNRGLQEEISRRGLILSQFWPDAPPTRHSFPIRNGAMSGYGMGTIVIEAGETSGTRIQARVAVEHGRPVILTDVVARGTKWGAALVGRPGVHVVSGVDELSRTIDHVLDQQSALGRAMDAFSNSTPTAA
jgi:DNA processing protein